MWYVISNAGGTSVVFVPSGTDPSADGTVISGPYATQADAVAGMAGKSTSPVTASGSTGDPWWVVEANIGAGATPTYQVIQGPPPGPNPKTVLTANGTTVKVTGPFSSQAAAQATIPAGAQTGPGGPTAPGLGPSNPLNVFGDIPSALTAIYDKLTDGKMWRSLGWLLLGVAMIISGLYLWIGPRNLPIPIPV